MNQQEYMDKIVSVLTEQRNDVLRLFNESKQELKLFVDKIDYVMMSSLFGFSVFRDMRMTAEKLNEIDAKLSIIKTIKNGSLE
jgi:hypothetical protein